MQYEVNDRGQSVFVSGAISVWSRLFNGVHWSNRENNGDEWGVLRLLWPFSFHCMDAVSSTSSYICGLFLRFPLFFPYPDSNLSLLHSSFSFATGRPTLLLAESMTGEIWEIWEIWDTRKILIMNKLLYYTSILNFCTTLASQPWACILLLIPLSLF